jgi:hypothetical protein
MNDNIRKFMNASIWITTILLMIRLLISWSDVKSLVEAGQVINLGYALFGYSGEAIGITAIMMAIFNKWAWKWKWLCWMHDMPILAKKYRGSIISDFDCIKRVGDIVIDQTFFRVVIRLKTEESISRCLTASFSKDQYVQHLIYTYQSDPRAEIQDRSPMHYGTAILNISNPLILEGNYFTSRKSRGSMKFESVKS